MSKASRRTDARKGPRTDRLQPWIAALVSALLPLLLLLMLLYASKPVVSTPQGASGGSRMKVDFLGEPRDTQPGPPSPPPPAAPVRKRKATSQVRTTLVMTSPDPVPPEDLPEPEPQREVPPPPQPNPADDDWSRLARRPASSPPTPRRTQAWTGHPPGWAPQDTALDNQGMDSGPGYTRGRGNDAGGQPSMEVGGYQVYYDTRSETLLRTWKDQGMKELAIPLPGTSYRMVCELDIAIRRGSGKCRLLDPSSPELQAIGDGREVINMIQVYKQGEIVWRGPGPYR